MKCMVILSHSVVQYKYTIGSLLGIQASDGALSAEGRVEGQEGGDH